MTTEAHLAGAFDLRAVPTPLEGGFASRRTVDGDGRVWELPSHDTTAGAAALLTFAMGRMLSRNERAASRRKTNQHTCYCLKDLLGWMDRAGRTALDHDTLAGFKQHLYASRKTYGAWGVYGRVLAAMRVLFDHGKLSAFSLPRNENQARALSEGKGGTTLSDLLPDGDDEGRDETLLHALLDFCWAELEDHLGRLRRGAAWREEIERNGFAVPYDAIMRPSRDIRLTYDQTLEIAVKLCWQEFDGQVPAKFDTNKLIDPSVSMPLRALSRLTRVSRLVGRTGLTRGDLLSHLYLSRAVMALSAVVFAAAQVNADSIPLLTLDMMRPDPTEPDRFRALVWDKARGGGDQQMPPFPVGGADARTVPRLWERLAEATASVRAIAPADCRDRLLLYMGKDSATHRAEPTKPRPVVHLSSLFSTTFPTYMADKSECNIGSGRVADPAFAAVRKMAGRLSLSIVRTTAINVASQRLNRDFSKTAQTGGHRSTQSLTTSYLANRRVQKALDAQVAAGQRFLVEWVREPITVVPDDERAIADRLQIDDATAKGIRADRFNLGTGVSLVNRHAIVIDTPLNALRMIQWLRRLREAEERVARDTPERWEAIYRPQIALFEQALNDFPRKTIEAAHEMDALYALPFPVVL